MNGTTRHGNIAGFTIIEVMLFLAISGLVLVGVLIGTGSIIARQRYNDAVQSFAEFLRRQYAVVISPQITSHEYLEACAGKNLDGSTVTGDTANRGQSDCVLYGSMLTISADGRTAVRTPLVGMDFSRIKDEFQKTYPDTQIEQITSLDQYRNMPTDIAILSLAHMRGGTPSVSSSCAVRISNPPGSETYSFRYDSAVQSPPDHEMPQTIFIIRSPINGTVKTYYSNGFRYSIDLSWGSEQIGNIDNFNNSNIMVSPGGSSCTNIDLSQSVNYETLNRELSISEQISRLTDPSQAFTAGNINMCLYSQDVFALAGQKRMVQIAANGRNQTAVEIIDADTRDDEGNERNLCNI